MYKKLVIIILLFTAVPVLLSGYLVYVNAGDALKREIFSKLESVTKLKANRLESFFSERKSDVIITAERGAIIDNLSAINQSMSGPVYIKARELLDDLMNSLRRTGYKYENIMLLDENGNLVYRFSHERASKKLNAPLPELKSGVFEKIKNGPYIGDLLKHDSGIEHYYLFVAAPVRDYRKQFIGALVFEVDMAETYALLRDNVGMGKSGESLLVQKISDDKILFISSLLFEPGAILERTVDIGDNLGIPAQRSVTGKDGIGVATDYRGQKVLSAWRYLPSLNWGLVCKMDLEEAFAPISELKRAVIAVFALTVLAGIVAICLVARLLSRPILKLHEGAEIIGQGNLDYKIGTDAKDEIGQLSRAFDEMRVRLKDLYNGLEKKVEERTQELVGKNKRLEDTKMAMTNLVEDLEDTMIKLENAMQSKSSFTSMVSHELRTPLTSLREGVAIVADGLSGPVNAKQKELLSIVKVSVDRLSRLINDVLDFQTLESGKIIFKMEDNDINEVVKEAKETMFFMAREKGLDFVLKLDENLPKTRFDRDKISQVLSNLISNSLKNTEKGGITIATTMDNNAIRVSVEDTGHGIKDEDMPRLFRQYEQLERKVGGTGLGLAICQSIIKAHGGDIWAESHPLSETGIIGHGATFPCVSGCHITLA